jgi:opacity protein-like surface antigen
MKKFFWITVVIFFALQINNAAAVAYGDLYNVEWCPCDQSQHYDASGSTVLGKTVMCPCDSMYDGYKKTLTKDVQNIKKEVRQAYTKAQNFKYYVGVEYNKSQVSTSKKSVNFDHLIFSDVGGINVPSDLMIDHHDNIGIVIGTRPTANLGIEAFYNRTYNKSNVTQKDNATVNNNQYHMMNTFTSQYQAFGIDLIGYLPITDYFDFIAFVGIGEYMFDNQAKFETYHLEGGPNDGPIDVAHFNFDENKLAWRIGGGIQFNIARAIMLRGMYRLIKLETETINYFQEFSVGVNFLF